MIDLSKFVDYPIWFKAVIFVWLALTIFIAATSLLIKPSSHDKKDRADNNESVLKEPAFSEVVESFTFSLGERGFSSGYKKDVLEKNHMNPFKFGNYSPVELYIEGDKLYADVKIYGGVRTTIY